MIAFSKFMSKLKQDSTRLENIFTAVIVGFE